MEDQAIQAQLIENLMKQMGSLVYDCVCKDTVIQQLEKEKSALLQALSEMTEQFEAMKKVETYTMNKPCAVEEDIEIDTCFVCE